MKKILTFIAIILTLSVCAQRQREDIIKNNKVEYELPVTTTTNQKALADIVDGVSNEGWFYDSKMNQYISLYRNTAIGIRHALNVYEEYKNKYNGVEKDNSSFSSLVLNADGIDYEMLALTIKSESSEIIKSAYVKGSKIASVSVRSTSRLTVIIITLKD